MENNMEREFVSYEQAVALKELGFDDKCLAYYKNNELYQEAGVCYTNADFEATLVWDEMLPNKNCTAPLKQQVFRWFREKYKCYANLSSWIYEEEIGIYHEFEIYIVKKYSHGSISYITYEEAENACIDKLIELAKQQDNGK